MLILRGELKATAQLGGGTNRKTGEVIPVRDVLQVETVDDRGLFQMNTITVPSREAWADKVGQTINLPVRAWASGSVVRFAYLDGGVS